MLDNIEVLSGAAAAAEGAPTFESGFRRPPRDPKSNARLVEAADIWSRGMSGSLRGRADLAEALTTSDFPYLLGGVFDRELLAQYEDLTPVWSGFATRVTVRDFRAKTLVDLLGGKGILDPVGQGAEYPARRVSEAAYTMQVGKRGARIPLTWEDVINDDLDAFRTLPERLAQGARDTEDYLATSQLVTASGANTTFFKSANNNAPAAVPLNADNLSAALSTISTRKDSEGRPVVVRAAVLVVPPALEVAARQLLNATEIRVTQGSNEIVTGNWLRGVVTLVVNPWLSVIATDNKAATRWFLLPDPNGSRPAVALGFLRGHEQPELRVKADTGQRVGGGTIDPMDGSFDMDDIQYRVRHVLGGTTVDPIATYVSNGS